MRLAVRVLGALGVAFAVVLAYVAFSLLGFRKGNFDIAAIALGVLPVRYLLRLPLRRWCLASLLPASLLIAFPIDVVLTMSARPGIRVEEASHGIACGGDACYGCTRWWNDVKWALVVAVPRFR